MKMTLAFETIVQDRLYLEGGKTIPTSIPLFTPDDNGIENDVTKIHEEPIARFFMESRASEFLFKHLQLPLNSFIAFSVKEPIRKNSHHPDFDLLICEADNPAFSTAIQFKRVKVKVINQEEDKINKLEGVEQIVSQVNIQRKEYGFHQNYLAIVIQTFGRNKGNRNVLFRHSSQQTFQEIYEFPGRDRVHDDVGIIFIQITQPTGRSYKDKVSIGVCFNKLATRLDQTRDLTNRIEELIRTTHSL